MEKQYTKDELWQIYEKLPDNLKEAVFSMETADAIWNICERNEIDEVSELSKLVGYVLLGILPPSEFQKSLETELKLAPEVAKKVFQEIHRQIFYPVQTELSKLYPTEVMPAAPAPATTQGKPVEEKPVEKEDTYREAIE